MQGVLLVDKPAGWTSFDVVNYVRRMARQTALAESYKVAKAESEKVGEALDFTNFQLSNPLPKLKVGHTGTLDPFATGLLVLLIGKEYTKKAAESSKLDKTYEVTMKLGETSTTGDPEGEISPYVTSTEVEKSLLSQNLSTGARDDRREAQDDRTVSDTAPTPEAILEALERFKGQIEQIPPAFSAIKVNGQRAYKLAREGIEVKIEPRKVTINRLEMINYSYPELKLIANVSSGTYIRTLVEDIGWTLDVGAYTTSLRRTTVGQYRIEDAINPKNLNTDTLINRLNTF